MASDAPGPAFGVESDVVCEGGRWVVYLVLLRWNPQAIDQPFRRDRLRIRDYATQADAEVARAWMQRGAARDDPFRSSGH